MRREGLGITRSLGREGIQVIGVDSSHGLAPGLKSTYCKPLLVPDPMREPSRVLKMLLEEASKTSQDAILYPATDAYVLLTSSRRQQLEERFLFSLPSDDVVQSLIDKRRQYKLATNLDIPCPRTYYPQTMQDVRSIGLDMEYPAIIKPRDAYSWWLVFHNKGFEVNDPEELAEVYENVFATRLEALIQSVVPGPDSNIYEVFVYMSRKSRPLASLVAKRIRQYPRFGHGTCLVTVHEARVLGMALDILQRIRYKGLGSVEIKRSSRDGSYVLIDVNPELQTQSILATAAGINLPLLQYLDLTGESISQGEGYADGVKWLDAAQDFLAFCQLNRKGRISMLDWVRSILDVDCHAYFARDDFKPFLSEYASKLARFAPELVRGFSMLRA